MIVVVVKSNRGDELSAYVEVNDIREAIETAQELIENPYQKYGQSFYGLVVSVEDDWEEVGFEIPAIFLA